MPGRRIEQLVGAGSPPPPPSLYRPGDDDVVPNEVLLTLGAAAAAGIMASIPSLPARGGRTDAGIAAIAATAGPLADILGGLDVQSITRVHGPTPPRVENGIAVAEDLGLETTLRVRYTGNDAPVEVAQRLNGLENVAWAEPNRWRQAYAVPNDPQFGAQWGLTRIGCPDAWDLTTGDPGVVVAVVDTGVDLNHPELAGLLVAGQDLVDFPPGSVPRPGWVFEGDFTGVDADPQDEVGHGTHVGGTICCASNNGTGVAGVAWDVRLQPVKVLARVREVATGRISGAGSAAHIAAGIRWATDNGARAINMSLGGYTDTTVEREAVAYAVSRGVVVVAAMGNDDTDTPSYPAAYPGVIAVAATDSSDRRASFSNRGAHVAISAPGVGVLSTYWDDTYATANGTSMASPHVAGVAALILSRNRSLTADQVANLIRTTAAPLRDTPTDPVPNDRYGHGLVQAGAAVRAAAPVPPSVPILTCIDSARVTCEPSFTFGCRSIVTLCRSVQVTCQPSLACRRREPIFPGLTGEQWEGYDPYDYDPYGTRYE